MTRGQRGEIRMQLNMQRSKIRAIIIMNMAMIQMRSKIRAIIMMSTVMMMAIIVFIQTRAAQTEDERAARRAQNAAQHAEVNI